MAQRHTPSLWYERTYSSVWTLSLSNEEIRLRHRLLQFPRTVRSGIKRPIFLGPLQRCLLVTVGTLEFLLLLKDFCVQEKIR